MQKGHAPRASRLWIYCASWACGLHMLVYGWNAAYLPEVIVGTTGFFVLFLLMVGASLGDMVKFTLLHGFLLLLLANYLVAGNLGRALRMMGSGLRMLHETANMTQTIIKHLRK